MEDALIDTLAHSYAEQLDWLRALNVREHLKREETEQLGNPPHRPAEADSIAEREEAMQMVERWNRLMLRTLRRCTTIGGARLSSSRRPGS